MNLKMEMKIDELNYGDVAVKLMPKLQEKATGDNAISKIIQAITRLPRETIYEIFDNIPQEEKNEIVSLMVKDNKDRILKVLEDHMQEMQLGICLTDVSVDEDLNMVIQIGDIDLFRLSDRLLPMVKNKKKGEGAVAQILDVLSTLPKALWNGVLKAMKQEAILQTGCYMVNHTQGYFSKIISDLMQKKGIRGSIGNLHAELDAPMLEDADRSLLRRI